jgi:hypothetical protein
MTEIQEPKGNTKRQLFTGIFVTISIAFVIFLLVGRCSENISPDVPTLALKKDNSIYLYSMLTTEMVEASIQRKESPPAITYVQVYKDNKVHYLNPSNIKELVQVMSGAYVTHPYKEKSYEGYVTASDKKVFELTTHNESTEVVGKQLMITTIVLTNNRDEKMEISWSFNPKENEYKAIKNTVVKDFWIETNPSPGETVVSSKDFLVIPITQLCEFFHCSYEFDVENQVLYVVE